jgi:hypothetical protein
MKVYKKKKKKPVYNTVSILPSIVPSIFTVCDDADCTDGICDVVIPQCAGLDYGQKIVKIFIAKPEAADFASVAAMAIEANWDTALGYDCTGASKDDRLVAIGDLYDGLKPASEVETEEGPYGQTELVNATHTVTFDIKRWDNALIDSINLLRCRSSLKLWYLTDTGYVFGGVTGFTEVGAIWGHIQHNGTGQGKVKSSNTLSWKDIDQSVPVLATFLKTKQNP